MKEGSTVIQQCTKCFSLRAIVESPDKGCVTCRERPRTTTTTTQPILLLPTSHDILPAGTLQSDVISLVPGIA